MLKIINMILLVVVVGDNSMRDLHGQKTAGENMARADINLAGNQLKLIKSIYKTNIPNYNFS